MPDESEMMSDLAAADATGDAELAQHIAGKIRAARPPEHGRLAEAAHRTAALLPAAGGIVGGVMGSGAGAALGFPTTGPGGIATTIGGGALGAGLLSGAGKSLQHFIDTKLGYENPSMQDVAADALKTGATDAAVTGGVSMAAPVVVAAAKPLAGPLRALANKIGARVLTGGTTPLSARKPLSDAALEAAHEAGAFTPFGTTQSAADTLAEARQTAGAQEGQLLAALEGSGVAGPNAGSLAQQLEAEAAAKAARSLGSPEPRMFSDVASELRTKPVDASGNLGLGAAEDMKRTLQAEAAKEYDKIARQYTPTGEAKKALASRMRQAVEDAVASGASPEDAAQFVAAKQKYGNLSQAANTAEEGAARAARRSPFSLTDMLMATAGYGHGGIAEGPGALLLSKLGRTYGPSTAAWGLNGAANALSGAGATVPAQVGAGAGALLGSEVQPSALMSMLDELRRKRAMMSPAVASND